MERNVLSFKVALSKGYEPGLYTYDPDKIPLGEYEAVLSFKVWSKRIIAVNCYFTKVRTGEKFVVTMYGNRQTGRYHLPGSVVDFSECAINATYRIAVRKNSRSRVVLDKAEPVGLLNV